MVVSPLVGIVVLNFNGQACLPRCLASLERIGYSNFFVIIVDNASTDDSLSRAREFFPRYAYISHRENGGFAAGMNIGARAALKRGAEYVWLLNNDTWVETETLSALTSVAEENQQAGLLSPFIMNAQTKTVWFGKGAVDFLRMRVSHLVPNPQELSRPAYQSHFLTGCALFIKKSVFERVGFLDERFFLYYEDADFSLRARAGRFRLLVVPSARVWHTEQSKMHPQKVYYLVLSGLLFFEKWATLWQKPYFLIYTALRRLKNGVDVMRGKAVARMVRRAYDDFYHGH